MFETINLGLDRTERSLTGRLAQHHVEAATRLLTGGIALDQLEAAHAAALGRSPVADAWRVPRAVPARPARAADLMACRAIRAALAEADGAA